MALNISSFKGKPSKRFHYYFVLWVLAWICGLILTLFLFLRPTPYGPPYVLDLAHYLPHAIFYMTFGLTVIVTPFFLVSLLLKNDEENSKRQRIFRIICAILLTISLFYQHVDNEILRFCNMHITPDFIRTYLMSHGVPDSLWTLLEEDNGGSNISIILLGVAPAFLLFYLLVGWRIPQPKHINRSIQWILFGVIVISLVFLPFLFRTKLFGSKNRQNKVAPPFILIADTIATWNHSLEFPKNMPELLTQAQQEWKQLDANHWTLSDPNKPWLKSSPQICPQTDKKYNFIIISFESFRAQSLSLFNKEQTIEATPYLNSLIKDNKAAYYTNYYTNAHPTIGGFMALHTGMLPHSSRSVAKAYTHDTLDSFVNQLRNNGWQAAFFGGSDPDWDNQRPWLIRWYDEVSYKPENNELDRLVMHDLSNWLKSERDTSKPFITTSFLITNHMPFLEREPGHTITDGTELKDKILNTMHYDDDVLHEFIDSIQNEPWYKDTIIVVTADHGMDLGDRDGSPDYNNLRTEALHIPLVIMGNHPQLKVGEHKELASHIDLGSTILELAGVCPENSVMGHSLISTPVENREVLAFKEHRASIRTDAWSAYILEDDSVMLYEGNDILQINDVADKHPDIAKSLKERARRISTTVDYSYQYDLLH